MDCAEFMKLISLYLDGELEESLQAEGDSHLRNCPNCCEAVIEWHISLDWLRRSLPEQAPPPRLWDDMWAEIEPVK